MEREGERERVESYKMLKVPHKTEVWKKTEAQIRREMKCISFHRATRNLLRYSKNVIQ